MDIVDRLRESLNEIDHGSSAVRLGAEAADEIERLRRDNEMLRNFMAGIHRDSGFALKDFNADEQDASK